MQYRNRALEQLMRLILESQAAMMSAMTQMQEVLLSGMAVRRPDEASPKTEESKPEKDAHRAEPQGLKPQVSGKAEPRPTRSHRGGTAERKASLPQQRHSKLTKPQPSWFEKRAESHRLSVHGVSHLRSLFDQGLSQSEAARQMGLTPAAVRRRFHEWSGKRAA